MFSTGELFIFLKETRSKIKQNCGNSFLLAQSWLQGGSQAAFALLATHARRISGSQNGI